jgi:hypothetical protein
LLFRQAPNFLDHFVQILILAEQHAAIKLAPMSRGDDVEGDANVDALLLGDGDRDGPTELVE